MLDYKTNCRYDLENNVFNYEQDKAVTDNPKDALGVKKLSLSKIPAIASAWCSLALMDGARKYGRWNWRDKSVQAEIYVDAAKRHLDAWYNGEQEAEDSGIHHLGHAMANMCILLDAEANGNLIDNRPFTEKTKEVFKIVMAKITSKIK